MRTDPRVRSADEAGTCAPSGAGPPAREALLSFHDRMTKQFVGILRTVEDRQRPVPHLSWTIEEVAAHVLSALRGYRNGVIGDTPAWSAPPHGVDENDVLLRLAPERDLAVLADAILEAGDAFRLAVRERTGETLRWHGGVEAPWVGVVGALAGDIMIHSWDIGVACSRPAPISSADADLYLASSLHITPFMVDADKAAGLSSTFELRARNGSSTTLAFRDGSLTVTPGHPAHADCRIVVEPVAYVLAVMGRTRLWRPAITGKMFVYGRRPWIGLKLRSLIHSV